MSHLPNAQYNENEDLSKCPPKYAIVCAFAGPPEHLFAILKRKRWSQSMNWNRTVDAKKKQCRLRGKIHAAYAYACSSWTELTLSEGVICLNRKWDLRVDSFAPSIFDQLGWAIDEHAVEFRSSSPVEPLQHNWWYVHRLPFQSGHATVGH